MKRAVIDIETVPMTVDNDDPEAIKKLSLDALTARVACVGAIALDEYRPCDAVAFVYTDEQRLLRTFWQWLDRHGIRRFVTHNGLSFDLPFLWRRSVIHRIKPSVALDLRKYRTEPVFDTMAVWGNWEHRAFASLGALSQGLGEGMKSGSGAEVSELWRAGRFDDIGRYCLDDCWLTYRCYCRLCFEEPIHDPLNESILVLRADADSSAGPMAHSLS